MRMPGKTHGLCGFDLGHWERWQLTTENFGFECLACHRGQRRKRWNKVLTKLSLLILVPCWRPELGTSSIAPPPSFNPPLTGALPLLTASTPPSPLGGF